MGRGLRNHSPYRRPCRHQGDGRHRESRKGEEATGQGNAYRCRRKSRVAIGCGVNNGKSTLTLRLKNPERWDIDNPYLYKLNTELWANGKRIDGSTTTAGLRSLEFNPDKGFALNGRWMKVKGVCLHHDAGVLGATVPEEVWERRLANLKSIGVNAIRCAHNP